MLQILPPLRAEAAAYVALERYFLLQNCCGGIALTHLLVEWLYAGRPVRRWLLALVAGLLVLGLFAASAGPRLKRLHLEKYGTRSTPQQRQLAGEGLRFWRGIVLAANVVVVIGLWVYVTELNTPGASARFVAGGKLRG
jgi:hypothetical protein